MNVSYILIFSAIACCLWAVASIVRITIDMNRRGIKTPFPFMGVLMFRNLHRYQKITVEETGKVGPLFYSFVVPINAAWILALAGLILRNYGY